MSAHEWELERVSQAEYRTLPPVPGQSLLQSAFWGALKATNGWGAHYLRLTPSAPRTHDDAHAAADEQTGKVPPRTQRALPLLALSRRLPLLGGTMLYIPCGPAPSAVVGAGCAAQSVRNTDTAGVAQQRDAVEVKQLALLQQLTALIRDAKIEKNIRLIRWDPLFENEFPADRQNKSMPHTQPYFSRVAHSVQPRYTIIVDLRPREDAILERMKAKTRYNIHLSERKEVVVRAARRDELVRWYAIYRDTCVRNRMGRRALGYFQALLSLEQRHNSDVRVELLLAHHQHKLLGGAIIAYYNKTATYLFGASANIMRNLMANYRLQWSAMQRAKEAGCTTYDLFGVSPTERAHHLSGLYRFKSGFGGEFVKRWGSFDHITKPSYSGHVYRACERAHFFYHRKIKKSR